MSVEKGGLMEAERNIVTTLVETQAINFEAIGTAFAKFGPSAALTLSGEDVFCGTMRRFIRVYRIRDEIAPIEDLVGLQQVARQLRG